MFSTTFMAQRSRHESAMNTASDVTEALAIGRETEQALRRTVELLNQAHGVGRVDFWFNFPGIDLLKYFHLFRAKREGKRARQLLEEFRTALGDLRMDDAESSLDRVGDTELPFEPGVVFADLFEDTLGDLWAQGRIESRRRKVNIALVRVRGVLRALEKR